MLFSEIAVILYIFFNISTNLLISRFIRISSDFRPHVLPDILREIQNVGSPIGIKLTYSQLVSMKAPMFGLSAILDQYIISFTEFALVDYFIFSILLCFP